jgi:OOP family OmpA-OmpF porin
MQSLTNNFTSKIKFKPFNGCLKIASLVVLLVLCFGGKAQNLVPNPSFEIFTNCPTTVNQINLVPPWTGADTSPDYFNSCANLVNEFGVPNVVFSYQQPRTGNAFAGLMGFYHPNTNIREYLQIQLSETLQANKTYKVFAYANLVNYEQYAIHNLGLNLSDVAHSSPIETVIELSSSIMNFDVAPIKDTMNWTRFGGIYKAQGNESYLAIGNFYNDSNTNRFL